MVVNHDSTPSRKALPASTLAQNPRRYSRIKVTRNSDPRAPNTASTKRSRFDATSSKGTSKGEWQPALPQGRPRWETGLRAVPATALPRGVGQGRPGFRTASVLLRPARAVVLSAATCSTGRAVHGPRGGSGGRGACTGCRRRWPSSQPLATGTAPGRSASRCLTRNWGFHARTLRPRVYRRTRCPRWMRPCRECVSSRSSRLGTEALGSRCSWSAPLRRPQQ